MVDKLYKEMIIPNRIVDYTHNNFYIELSYILSNNYTTKSLFFLFKRIKRNYSSKHIYDINGLYYLRFKEVVDINIKNIKYLLHSGLQYINIFIPDDVTYEDVMWLKHNENNEKIRNIVISENIYLFKNNKLISLLVSIEKVNEKIKKRFQFYIKNTYINIFTLKLLYKYKLLTKREKKIILRVKQINACHIQYICNESTVLWYYACRYQKLNYNIIKNNIKYIQWYWLVHQNLTQKQTTELRSLYESTNTNR